MLKQTLLFMSIFLMILSINLVNAEIKGKLIKIEEIDGNEDIIKDFKNSFARFSFSNDESYKIDINENGEYIFNPEEIYCWNGCNIFPKLFLKGVSFYEEESLIGELDLRFNNEFPEDKQDLSIFTNIFINNKVDRGKEFSNFPQIDNSNIINQLSSNYSGDVYSIFWNGTLIISESNFYNFKLDLTGPIKVWIDGNLVFESEEFKEIGYHFFSTELEEGEHNLKLEYFTSKDRSSNIYWSLNGQDYELVDKTSLIFLSGGSKMISDGREYYFVFKAYSIESTMSTDKESYSVYKDYSAESTTYPTASVYLVGTLDNTERPIIFVHGWSNDEVTKETFGDFPNKLEDLGYETLRLVYNPANLGNRKNAGMLSSVLKTIVEPNYPDFDKFDIIAHSMGGLVTRGYIQGLGVNQNGDKKPYEKNIRKLVLIASPMYGTYYANLINDKFDFPWWCDVALWWKNLKVISEATYDLELGSEFTWDLNSKKIDKSIEYLAFGGYKVPYDWADCGNDLESNDGAVTLRSSNLLQQGVPFVILPETHFSIMDSSQTFNIVEAFINEADINITLKEGEYHIDPETFQIDNEFFLLDGSLLLKIKEDTSFVEKVELKNSTNSFKLTKNPQTNIWFYLYPENGVTSITNFKNFLPSGNYNLYVNNMNTHKNVQILTGVTILEETSFFNIELENPKSQVYNDGRIYIDIEVSNNVDEIVYIDYEDKDPSESILCNNCKGYKKQRSFNEGFHNLTFKAIDKGVIVGQKSVSFNVDSKLPKISKTYPQKGFTNGTFKVEFEEDNPNELILRIKDYYLGHTIRISNIKNICDNINEKYVCSITLDIENDNGEKIEYWFILKDIANNIVSSKHLFLEVDSANPVLNNLNSFWFQGTNRYNKYIYFNFYVTDVNFDEITYVDWSDGSTKEKILCSKLKAGRCEKKKSFKKGRHNLTIYIKDKAGNSITKNIQFNVN